MVRRMIASHRNVPHDLGVIGVDNSRVGGLSEPTLTSVNIDVSFSAHEIVNALLHGTDRLPSDPMSAVRASI
jgi:DNA-binding LacI/PurR family transcriptional regulator